MVTMNQSLSTQALKNPIDQAKDTASLCISALDSLTKGADPKFVAQKFVDGIKQIWDLDKDPNAMQLMGSSRGGSLGQATSALGLYAKVFTLGLDIAYGADPGVALNNSFKTALHEATCPQAPSGFSRPWDSLRYS